MVKIQNCQVHLLSFCLFNQISDTVKTAINCEEISLGLSFCALCKVKMYFMLSVFQWSLTKKCYHSVGCHLGYCSHNDITIKSSVSKRNFECWQITIIHCNLCRDGCVKIYWAMLWNVLSLFVYCVSQYLDSVISTFARLLLEIFF